MVKSGSSGLEYDAWLASAKMPSALLLEILEYARSPKLCYDAFQQRDAAILALIPPRFQRILQQNGTADILAEYKNRMEKHDIHVIRIHEPEYPEKLECISDSPPLLFYQGNPDCLNRRIIAMVGSRSASYSGQKATVKLAEELSRRGISIISGMACGIDASAHQGCIDGGSGTIAVTACGLDRIYPAENEVLHGRILDSGGIILSEYSPGEKPLGWHFPVRNRIITGIADALVLMEARIRSGSMTSVRHALDQGKDVFVYPGDPASDHFEGNHQLLREGGIYFTSADDILEDMGWLDNQTQVRQNSDCLKTAGSFTQDEALIISVLEPGTLGFEELLKKSGLDPSVTLSTLTILQIRGIIEALPGKQYRIKQ